MMKKLLKIWVLQKFTKVFKQILNKNMSVITINGVTYSGRNIQVINNNVRIDGKDVTIESKEINITVEGPIEELKVDACNKVSVNGAVKNVSSISGKIEINGNVSGNVSTISGNIHCENVSGSISSVSGKIYL